MGVAHKVGAVGSVKRKVDQTDVVRREVTLVGKR